VPELRQLRAFVAVAEEGSFTRASERLHLVQQAVSKSIRQLERELGVQLVERTTREMRLTPAGAALLESGREVLLAADAAFERARSVGRGLEGTVRVGISPAIAPAEQDEVGRVLRDGAPELSISFHEVRPGEIAQQLRERRLELVLARTAPDTPEVDSAALRPTPVELLVPTGHRLEGAASIRLAELDGERLLIWSRPGTPFTDLLLRQLAAAGAHVEPVQARITGGGEVTEVAETGAVALVPRGFPGGAAPAPIPIEDPVSLPLLLLWRAGVASPAVRRVRAGMSD
jgi:DNA-binding transcriptional LysR family regulator